MSKRKRDLNKLVGKAKTARNAVQESRIVLARGYQEWEKVSKRLVRAVYNEVKERLSKYKFSLRLEDGLKRPESRTYNWGRISYHQEVPDDAYSSKMLSVHLIVIAEHNYSVFVIQEGGDYGDRKTNHLYKTPAGAIHRFVAEIKARSVCASLGVV